MLCSAGGTTHDTSVHITHHLCFGSFETNFHFTSNFCQKGAPQPHEYQMPGCGVGVHRPQHPYSFSVSHAKALIMQCLYTMDAVLEKLQVNNYWHWPTECIFRTKFEALPIPIKAKCNISSCLKIAMFFQCHKMVCGMLFWQNSIFFFSITICPNRSS